MIAHLHGIVSSIGATSAVLDVGGLGFEAQCTARALASLRVGEQCRLETLMVVRQEQFTLYGFLDPTERAAFNMLTSVNSVGPRMALGVLSLMDPPDLVAAIRAEDVRALTRAPGVGKKSAERMLVELKDRILQLGVEETDPTPEGAGQPRPAWRDQVSNGLQGLGWSAKEAELACDAVEPRVEADPDIGVAQLMRAALQALAK